MVYERKSANNVRKYQIQWSLSICCLIPYGNKPHVQEYPIAPSSFRWRMRPGPTVQLRSFHAFVEQTQESNGTGWRYVVSWFPSSSFHVQIIPHPQSCVFSITIIQMRCGHAVEHPTKPCPIESPPYSRPEIPNISLHLKIPSSLNSFSFPVRTITTAENVGRPRIQI